MTLTKSDSFFVAEGFRWQRWLLLLTGTVPQRMMLAAGLPMIPRLCKPTAAHQCLLVLATLTAMGPPGTPQVPFLSQFSIPRVLPPVERVNVCVGGGGGGGGGHFSDTSSRDSSFIEIFLTCFLFEENLVQVDDCY